ncbi:ribonuclease HII [Alphaproteobacteria bacterium]|nr:ribonuclease HII [Alphaproteobacteria bacterium]
MLAAPAVRAGQAFTLSEAVSTSKIALAYSETETENASGATTCIKIEDSIGIDEVGRGPLAGPVVSAAVWICADLARYLEDNSKILPVRDSKKMTRKQRQKIVDWIDSCPSDQIKYSIGCATVEEIDELNILNASLLSMERAYNGVCGTGIFSYPALVLVDGNVAPDIKGVEIKTIVKGDDKVLSISLASIIAKEYRDNYMRNLSEQFPHYSWDTNVGYGTAAHLQAIAKYGITPHHRKSFAPVSQLSLPLD